MSEGLKLISAAIAAGSQQSLSGVDRDMLLDSEVEVYDFVKQHVRSYRELPSATTVHAETGKRLPSAPEPLQYYLDQINERYEYNQIRERFASFREALTQRNMEAVANGVSAMSRIIRRRRNGVYQAGESVQMNEAGRLVTDRLRRVQGTGGISGIVTGWPIFDAITGGYQNSDLITWVGRMSLGKCMDPATPVLMHSGQIRPIGEVKAGDLLMGPDSQPRTVLATTTGIDTMYRVTPMRGEAFVCNGAHILVTRCNFDTDHKHTKGSRHLYSVNDFLALPQRVRNNLRLIRTSVDFTHHAVEISPYFVGLWLGDGTVGWPRITTMDPEILQAIEQEAAVFGMTVTKHKDWSESKAHSYHVGCGKGKENVILGFVRTECFKAGEKRIPLSYLRNSREVRLQLLAGLIDTDGSLHDCRTAYEITTKYPGLRDDILYLARSLGLCATSKEKSIDGSVYHRIYISGEINFIPVRVPRKANVKIERRGDPRLQTFTVERLGPGPYAGVELDKDHLYLLGDFTITHNSYVLLRQAQRAHDAGHNVLFVTTEMGIEAMARRYAALALGVNPTYLKNGAVSTHVLRRISALYRDMAGAERFRLFAVGMSAKVEAITNLCHEFMPDIVFIDGVYLLRPTDLARNASRTDRVSAVFDELRAVNLEMDRPFVVTTQFNRMAGRGGKDGTLENIGYTDAIGTHSSHVVAMKEGPTENPKESRTFDFLKGREGESGSTVINFKFAPLDMDEMSEEQRQAEGEVTNETTEWMGIERRVG